MQIKLYHLPFSEGKDAVFYLPYPIVAEKEAHGYLYNITIPLNKRYQIHRDAENVRVLAVFLCVNQKTTANVF